MAKKAHTWRILLIRAKAESVGSVEVPDSAFRPRMPLRQKSMDARAPRAGFLRRDRVWDGRIPDGRLTDQMPTSFGMEGGWA